MRLIQVDSFAQAPFTGNPAAVCLLTQPAEERWMQQVAGEMNLAATAFVEPRPAGFGLRWFSPKVELTLCGHGTLAAAHVLFEEGLHGAQDQISFDTIAEPSRHSGMGPGSSWTSRRSENAKSRRSPSSSSEASALPPPCM